MKSLRLVTIFFARFNVLLFLILNLLVSEVYSENIIGKNPQEIIQLLQLRVEQFEGYQVQMSLVAYGSRPKKQNMILWYKKGGFIRLKQLGPYREGSLVVFNPLEHKKFHGRLGGFLSFFTVKLDPDSWILRGVTGDSIQIVDYLAILKACTQVIEDYLQSFQIEELIWNKQEVFLLTVEINKKGEEFDFIQDENIYRFFLTKSDLFLVRLERYKDQSLLNTIEWKKFQAINHFDSDLFQLR